MAKNIYEFTDWRSYLKQELPVVGPKRGVRTRLAEHLRCHTGFVTRVLAGDNEFTLEHAIQIAEFLSLTHEEQDYFLLLVHRDRAGHHSLKKYYTEKIDLIRKKQNEIKAQVGKSDDILEQDRVNYYSSWHPIAIHMCTMAPPLQRKEKMAEYLGLSLERVGEILEFLIHAQLVERVGDRFQGVYGRFHLAADSPLIANHHRNWRMQAIEALDRKSPSSLHYSVALSISQKAFEEIRKQVLKLIQDVEPVIREAKDEGVFVMNMDLFEMNKSHLNRS